MEKSRNSMKINIGFEQNINSTFFIFIFSQTKTFISIESKKSYSKWLRNLQNISITISMTRASFSSVKGKMRQYFALPGATFDITWHQSVRSFCKILDTLMRFYCRDIWQKLCKLSQDKKYIECLCPAMSRFYLIPG